jgi:hypothetical protein
MRDTAVVRKWLHGWTYNMLSVEPEHGMKIADLTRQCFHYLTRIDKDVAIEEQVDFWWMCVSRTVLKLLYECQSVDIDCNHRQGVSIMHAIHREEVFA